MANTHGKRAAAASPREALNISTSPQTLNAARNELMKKYRYIPEKSVVKFLSDHVPHLPATVLEDVMAQLKKKIKLPKERGTRAGDFQHCTPPTQAGTIYGHTSKSPAKMGVQEAQAFSLYDLINAILELAAQINGRAWVAHSSKQEHLHGEKPNSPRPDSFLYLISQSLKEVGWEQLFCVGELKKNNKTKDDELDNWGKVVWGMHHIMRNDPCRLFTFGYNMEDDQARLWYHSRSSVFVSESFNWTLDPKPFIRFILALVLTNHNSKVSPDSKALVPPRAKKDELPALYDQHSDYLERIGIDPTMNRVLVGDSIQYEITVRGLVDGKEGTQRLVFVTKEVLCDFKVDDGTGRSTRVWVVHEKDGDESNEFVLKDVWLEDGAVVEGESLENLENLVKGDKRQHSVPVKDWYRDHLLHMHTHEKLAQKVLGVCGKHKHIRLLPDPSASTLPASFIHSGSRRADPRGGPSSVSSPQGDHEFDKPDRFHYRIVLRGAMIPLESVRCRRTCSQVVIGIFRACWVLWIYGMVHRDVSSWNSFWDPRTRTGRLGDFDYLVAYGETETGRTKTVGTPHFWSVEVEARSYLYKPQRTPWYAINSAPLNKKGRNKSMFVFKHNLLHDLESVFWVSLWTFLYLVDIDNDASQDHHGTAKEVDEQRRMLYHGIFPDGEPGDVHLARCRFIGVLEAQGLNRREELREYTSYISENTLSLINFHFEELRGAIVSHFVDLETALILDAFIPSDNPAFTNALNVLQELLGVVQSRVGSSDYPVSPLSKHQFVLERELAPWTDPEDAPEDVPVQGPSRSSKKPRTSRKRGGRKSKRK
ncbi:hypothetical protein E1B28_012083 [Marasmius oreades]|uniref:Fungal-type protein kinase domain-containing protein n=1 Tax=Marasmius oreades TaxID=181124 RepID=A0A9P7RQT8_9AGAR|nr:uncharacterized protein E1B28_012083 [Marasmius oreades]KAG7088049.1 hypothetical protein E1B28_012083 [Marasmius oreades]